MSEDRENQENSNAGDSLLSPVQISENQALASPSKVEVKFVNDGSPNGEAVELGVTTQEKNYSGMGKEELMRQANDPFWVRTRWILFALFWLLWLAMLLGAIAIIVLAPRCAAPKKAQWWERSPLYEVNVRSFKDGSRMADGIGDLQGVRSSLNYIKDLGVNGVILSSIYQTGKDQSPESVTDFKAIHPDFGTLEEFKELVADMKAKDLRVVLDLVPNHSGKQHKWFQDSIKKISPYKDYYVWSAGKTAGSGQRNNPPNNWKTLKGESAWEWNEERNEFYLHQFETGQPDLNFLNPAVKEEFNKIFKFWLDLGVSGFQLYKTAYLVEDVKLRDDPTGTKPGPTHESYDFYDHKFTSHLYDSFKLVAQWRSIIRNTSDEKILLIRDEFPIGSFIHSGEADNSTAAAGDLLQTPKFLHSVNAAALRHSIRGAIDRSPSHKPVWSLGDGETQRLASRFSGGLADAMMMIILLLPGTPLIYYGDEIGLKDVPGSSSDRALGLMQWNSSTNAGFTSDAIKPWINPVNPAEINIVAQQQFENSHLKTVMELIETRKTMVAVMLGKTNITALNASRADGTIVVNSILVFTRIKSGNPGVLVAVNPLKEELSVDFGTIPGEAEELTVHVKTSGFSVKDFPIKGKIPKNAVKLPPETGITFTFVYKGEED